METHRSHGDGRSPGRRGDPEPLDVAWLERKAHEYAARWESTRRGVAEVLERKIRQRCERTGEQAETILARVPEVVERLADRNYVNDQRAADQLFERLRRQGRSQAEIRRRLDRRGVPPSIADALLRDEGPEADLRAAWQLAKKRGLGPYCSDTKRREADRQRHLGILARQGFSSDVAHRVIDAAEPANASDALRTSERP
jgi:regulatory protein